MVYASAYRAYRRSTNWRSGISAAAKAAAISAAGYAVNRVARYGMRKVANYGRKTIGFAGYGRKKYGIRYGTSYGQLNGKVKPNKYRARRYRRRGSNAMKMRPVVRRTFKGVSVQKEYVGSVSGEKSVYITHSTAGYDEIMLMFVMACIKELMIQNGFTIQSWVDSRNQFLVNGDILQFVYKQNPRSPTASTYQITVGSTHTTWIDIANALVAAINTAFTLSDFPSAYLFSFQGIFQNGDKPTQISLLDVKLSFFIKSALKMQNRTVAAAGEDEVDVNNVPLYGKIYHGSGNGPLHRDGSVATMICGRGWNEPAAINGTSYNSFTEPFDPSDLTFVKSWNKIGINPGGIKTTLLTSKFTIGIQKFWQDMYNYHKLLYSTSAPTDYTGTRFSLGLFNTVGLEKVIGKSGDEGGINVTFEIDTKGWCSILSIPNKYTSPYKDVK
nr:putative capsid protein [Cressdnaviricota sp.]